MINLITGTLIEFDYVNYKGELGHRRAEVQGVFFGSNEYHPEDQFLLAAFDMDKLEHRTFAMADMMNVKYFME